MASGKGVFKVIKWGRGLPWSGETRKPVVAVAENLGQAQLVIPSSHSLSPPSNP